MIVTFPPTFARPVLPLLPSPVPAKVVMTPVAASTRRTRVLIEIYQKQHEVIREALAAEHGIPVKWRHPYPHPNKRGDLR